MSILYNKTATSYRYTRNASMVSSYAELATFVCNIQPVSVNDWFEGEMVYKMKKMYTDYDWLQVWDKIVIDSVSYILKEYERWDGKYRKYYKSFIQKSEGS